MTLRFQRLVILIISLILITGAIILILINTRENIVFFYTPTELFNTNINFNNDIRIGGFVKHQSIKKISDSIGGTNFVVTDNKNEILVEYRGILPDLFREKQGVVVEGKMYEEKIIAKRVFAKHDENYMPKSIKNQLVKKNYWKNNYDENAKDHLDLPKFISQSLYDEKKFISNNDINDKIVLINFFASWCEPCKVEHPLIINLKDSYPDLFILGFNFKDDKKNSLEFLTKNGNPYDFTAIDNGDIGFEFGVFGLPESYISLGGKIIYKHTGPLTKEIILEEITPILKF